MCFGVKFSFVGFEYGVIALKKIGVKKCGIIFDAMCVADQEQRDV